MFSPAQLLANLHTNFGIFHFFTSNQIVHTQSKVCRQPLLDVHQILISQLSPTAVSLAIHQTTVVLTYFGNKCIQSECWLQQGY